MLDKSILKLTKCSFVHMTYTFQKFCLLNLKFVKLRSEKSRICCTIKESAINEGEEIRHTYKLSYISRLLSFLFKMVKSAMICKRKSKTDKERLHEGGNTGVYLKNFIFLNSNFIEL